MFVSELRARNAPPVSLEASVCPRKMSFTDALHVSASEGQSRVQVLSICVFGQAFALERQRVISLNLREGNYVSDYT